MPHDTPTAPAGQATLVEAAPGSGKTTWLANRIKELVARGTSPRTIVACCFNRAAAAELRARVGHDLAAVSTVHALALRLLRRHGHRIGISDDFDVCPGEVTISILHQVADPFVNLNSLAQAISTAKALGLSPADPDADALRGMDRHAWAAYEGVKQELNALDFGDLVARAADALEASPEVRRWFANAHLFIDEGQDLDPAMWRLVHATGCSNVHLVGDRHQLIHGWRGVRADAFDAFAARYRPQRIRLGKSWRCPDAVARAAARVLPGAAFAGNGNPGEVTERRFAHAGLEFAAVAEDAKKAARHGTVGVLARRSKTVQALRRAFGSVPAGVNVATVHAAKGREWDVVFYADTAAPAHRDADPDEESRITFVALTRARHALHLSCAG